MSLSAAWNAWIVRSLQKHLQDSLDSVTLLFQGQKQIRADLAEWIDIAVDGPRWGASRDNARTASITVDLGCFARLSADVMRVDEVAGLAAAALDRAEIEIKNYPSAGASRQGWLRMMDAELAVVGKPLPDGQGDTPLSQINVSAEGRVEMD